MPSGSVLERRATEGKGPVHERYSTSGKARVNLRGPPRKAKYKLATDSARVP